MRLVDVHCHLESDYFKDGLPGIIAGAKAAGVVKLITSSITPDEWGLSESIARSHEAVEFALGVHPWYCKKEDIARIAGLSGAKARGAVAIGEIGLDRKTAPAPYELQREVFELQLRTARDLELPVIIHCRGAFDDVRLIVKRTGLCARGGVVHSFSGSVEVAEAFMKLGLSFSFGGALTYRNSKKKEEVLKKIYPDRLMLETDSPDIPPVEARAMPNVPANILYGLRAAAEILGAAEEKIAEITTANAARMFALEI